MLFCTSTRFLMKTRFHKKGFKIASFWKCEFLEFGNGLFASCKGNQSGFRNPEICLSNLDFCPLESAKQLKESGISPKIWIYYSSLLHLTKQNQFFLIIIFQLSLASHVPVTYFLVKSKTVLDWLPWGEYYAIFTTIFSFNWIFLIRYNQEGGRKN